MPPRDPSINALWVAFALLFSLIIGVAAAFLGWLGGQHPSIAILTGGTGFAGAVALVLMIKKALGLSPRRQFSDAASVSATMSSVGELGPDSLVRPSLRQPQDWQAR
jgi:hypothetical protein